MARTKPGMVRWRPAPTALGQRADRGSPLGSLGESILAAISVTSVQGTINPSFMDLRYRSADPGMRAEAKRMLDYSLGVEILISLVIGWGFRNWIPGAVGAGSSLALYYLFVYALEAGPPPPNLKP